MKLSFLLVTFAWASLHAQSTPPAVPPSPQLQQAEQGLESPDEARAIVNKVIKEEDQLRGLLPSLNPQVWYEKKGAPSTYVIQWQSAQQQLRDVDTVAKYFLLHIDSLAAAMDLYFRMEGLELSSKSLNEGAQRYADKPAADQLSQFVAHAFDNRQRFRDYVKDLATNMEQNYKIADEEAQRCRAQLSKEPPCSTSSTSRKPRKS